MAPHRSTGLQLELVQNSVAADMDRILKHFRLGAKIAVLVRHPGFPGRDFMMTDDDPRELLAMIERCIAESPPATSDPVGFPPEDVQS